MLLLTMGENPMFQWFGFYDEYIYLCFEKKCMEAFDDQLPFAAQWEF